MYRMLKILSSAFLLTPFLVLAYQNPGAPTGFVNDFAGMITSEQNQSLEKKISSFEKNTSNELSVVTISNLGGDTIENFAVKLFQDWRIGKNKKDNGILLLISRDDRQMRIEVGYGLEGALTDAQSFWIIKNVLRPAFQAGDYYGGINGGVDNLISIIKGEFKPDTTNLTKNNGLNVDSIFFLFWILWIFFVWTGSILARSKSWWGGGIVGGAIAFVVGLGFTLVLGFVSALILIPIGFWLDRIVSKRYTVAKENGQPLPWWIGGRGSLGGGGGFGGFGGGRSGGGGSSGSW